MRLPRVCPPTWLLIAVAGVVTVPVALDIFIFQGTPLAFRLNATQVTAVPVALMAVTAAALVWVASGLKRGRGRRFTVRGMMVAVLLFGVGFGTVRWWVRYNFATVYAASYREDRFAQVRVGMTRREVESLLGRPLRKAPMPGETWEPDDIWVYSEPPGPGCLGDNYWRRWVVFDRGKDGRVAAIVNDYYWD